MRSGNSDNSIFGIDRPTFNATAASRARVLEPSVASLAANIYPEAAHGCCDIDALLVEEPERWDGMS